MWEFKGDEAATIEHWASFIDPYLREEFGVFETGQPFLAFFDDMARFVPISEYETLRTR